MPSVFADLKSPAQSSQAARYATTTEMTYVSRMGDGAHVMELGFARGNRYKNPEDNQPCVYKTLLEIIDLGWDLFWYNAAVVSTCTGLGLL